jgi:hypothetical protein
LYFRGDIPPFLVHLARETDVSPSQNLESILKSRSLVYGHNLISDARFGVSRTERQKQWRYFSALSFTETPLGEIHTFLEIRGRMKNLSLPHA